MNKFPMTVRGAELLREELQKLKSNDRPQVIQAIAEARAHGDLKENAEYHAAKDQQGFLEGRIKELEAKVRELESTLAQSHVKLFAYESLIEVAEEHYDADFKKNFGAKQSSGALNNAKKQGSK